MHTPLPNLVDLINQYHRILNLARLESPHDLARDRTYIGSPETLQSGGVTVSTQSYSVELSTEGGRYRVSYRGLTYTWRADETKNFALD
jgi:hypothetical protein